MVRSETFIIESQFQLKYLKKPYIFIKWQISNTIIFFRQLLLLMSYVFSELHGHAME